MISEPEIINNYAWVSDLIKIQQEVDVPKNRWNEFGKYKYRSAEDIWSAAKPVFAKYGYLVLATDRIEWDERHNYQVCRLTVYSVDGIVTYVEGWAREDESRKGMDSPQLSGSASSYACKRAWGNLLGLDDVKDPDAYNDHASNNNQPKQASNPKRERTAPANHITDAQSKMLHTMLDKTGLICLKPEYKKFLQMKGLLSGESIKDMTKDAATQAIQSFHAHMTEMFANKEVQKLLIPSFKNIVKKEDKIKILNSMIQEIEEVVSMPDWEAVPSAGCDGYFQLFLGTIHNQEHNRIMEQGSKTGMSQEEIIAEIEKLGMQPRVISSPKPQPQQTNQPGTSILSRRKAWQTNKKEETS